MTGCWTRNFDQAEAWVLLETKGSMSKSLLLTLPLAALLLWGCGRSAKPTVEITAEDIQIARQALPISEVSLMLRSGYSEQKVLAEIQRRRVTEKIDGTTEDKLKSSGASASLIAALKSEQNVLTPNQEAAFDDLNAQKSVRAQQAAESREAEQVTAANERALERQRQQNLQVQTALNVQRSQHKDLAHEQASRTYEAQRKSLESQIRSTQTELNQARRYGYKEAQLRTLVERRDALEKQLRDLTPPLKPF